MYDSMYVKCQEQCVTAFMLCALVNDTQGSLFYLLMLRTLYSYVKSGVRIHTSPNPVFS